LLFKAVDQDAHRELELNRQCADLNEVEEDFWSAFDGLDRQALLDQTVALLKKSGVSMSVADLARELPPTHDLETIALWLSMAREVDVPIGSEREVVDVLAKEGAKLRFDVPKIEVNAAVVAGLDWEP
jgi:hypothetical protein